MFEKHPVKLYSAGSFAALMALASGCVGDIDGPGGAGDGLAERRNSCTYLTFDLDGAGDPVAAGDVVAGTYAGIGVTIDVWDDAAMTEPGLPVAFDTNNPTGGDNDLSFTGLGNVLINQENFSAADAAAGQVAEPDDNAGGGLFEVRFDAPVCVKSIVLLDIDVGEDPAELVFYDAADTVVATHTVAPMGDGVRIDVPLPAGACNVSRMTVLVSSSGAIDDIEFCGDAVPPPELEIWTRVFDGGGDDIGTAVAANANRDVFVAGISDVGATSDGIVRKYDAAGLLAWTHQVDFGGNDEAHGIDVDSDGDILVAGRGMAAADDDLFVRKLGDDGVEMWTRTFDGGGNDAAFDVAVDPSDDSVIVVGMAEVAAGTDIFMRKYDDAGNVLWTKGIDVGARDIAYSVFSCPGGPIAVAGQVDNGTDLDFWVAVFDADGNEQWRRVFNGSGDSIARGVAIDGDGNVLVGGEAWNGVNSDGLVRKYDAEGNLLFSLPIDSGGPDAVRDLASDAAGSLIVTGFLTGTSSVDGFTRKYAANGTELWTELFDRGGADEGYGVTADIAGSVISTGYFEATDDLDLWVSKYRP